MSNTDGTFIVFEGGEGSGKDTQIEILKDKLSGEAVYTREPGGTEVAEQIRDLLLGGDTQMSPKTELSLFCGARADHVEKVIGPSLESGKAVVCNRFDLSTFAYQIYGREQIEYKNYLQEMNEYVVGTYQPDAYIYLELSTEEGLKRVGRRAEDDNRIDQEKLEFHKRVQHGYRQLADERDSCFTVDGEQSVEEVADDVWQIVQGVLSK